MEPLPKMNEVIFEQPQINEKSLKMNSIQDNQQIQKYIYDDNIKDQLMFIFPSLRNDVSFILLIFLVY